MFDHADLHRHDLELLADLLANAVFTATADTGQLLVGQFVNDFDTRKIGGQRLTFAPSLGRSYDLFFNRFVDRLGHASASLNKAIYADPATSSENTRIINTPPDDLLLLIALNAHFFALSG